MQFHKLSKYLFFSFLFLYSSSLIYGQKQFEVGFRSIPSSTVKVDVRSAHGDCKQVTSSKPTNSFVSTKYKTGWWQTFKNNTPANLTLNPCVSGEFVATLWSNWKDWLWNAELAYFNAIHWTMDGSGSIYILSADNISNTTSAATIKKYSSTWVLMLTIGSWASGDNNLSGTAALFNTPTYISVDDHRNIYVTDTGNYKIKKYSSTGAWMLSLGSTRWDTEFGGTNSQFYLPVWSYAISGSFIAVIDWYHNTSGRNSMKVKYFSQTWGYLRTTGNFKNFQNNNLSGTAAQLSYPNSMFINSSWNLIIKDTASSNLKRYTNTGIWMATYDLGHTYADYAVYQDGYMQQDGSGRIFTLNCAGQCIRVYSSTGIMLSQIGDYRNTTWIPNKLSGTAAIIADEYSSLNSKKISLTNNGVFVIVDHCMINKYSWTGAWILTIGTEGNEWQWECVDNQLSGESAGMNPITITTDSSGSLYLYSPIFDDELWSYTSSKIKKYSATWTWMMDIWGPVLDNDLSGTGAGLTDNPIWWYDPFLYVRNNGYIYFGLDRLKVYSSTGAWILTLWDGTTNGNYLSQRSAGLSYCAARCLLIDNSWSIYAHNGFYFFRKYSSTGAFLFPVGSPWGWPGDNNGNYTGARIDSSDLWAVDSANNLYLLDHGNSKIKKYSSTWAWMLTIGSNTDYYYGNDLSGTNAILTPNLGSAYAENSSSWYTYIDDKVRFTRSWSFYYMNSMGDQVKSYSSGWVLLSTLWRIKNGAYIPDNDLSGTSAYLSEDYYQGNIALDPSGNLWVVAGKKVKKYSATGSHLVTIWSSTTGDNNLSGTSARLSTLDSDYNMNMNIAFDRSGSVYVQTVFPQKVKKYSSTGAWLMTLWSGSNILENNLSTTNADWYRPYNAYNLINSLQIDSSNNIYLMTNDPSYYGTNARRIKKYSSTGSWMQNIGRHANYKDQNSSSWILLSDVWYMSEQKIVTDGSGNTWIPFFNTTYLSIYEDPWNVYSAKLVFKKYNSSGTYMLTLGSEIYGDNEESWTGANFRKYLDFFTDREGSLYVFDTSDLDYSDRKLKKYTSTGAWVFTLPLYSMGNPAAVDVDRDGNISLYTGDYTLGTIDRYDKYGNFLLSIPVSTMYSALKSDMNGNLLTNSWNSIVMYDQSWSVLVTIGDELNSGDNELSGTAALLSWDLEYFTYDGDIYIAMGDVTTSAKIKRYSSTGAWLMTIGGASGGENSLWWTWAHFGTGNTIFQYDIDTNGVILVNNPEKRKLKMYSGLNGEWLGDIGDGLSWVNELSWTGARAEGYMYMNFEKDAFFLYDTTSMRIKKFIP